MDKLKAECAAHESKSQEAAASLEEMRTRLRDAVQAKNELESKVDELTQRINLTKNQTEPPQETEKVHCERGGC